MSLEVMKEKARDELIRLTDRDLDCKFGNLNQKQQSIAMVRFYIKEIHNPTKSMISDDDIQEGVVDGSNDLGCDFIYKDDGHVLIIQSKYRKSGAAENIESISHFQSILTRFKNPDSQANKYLKEALQDINWENDTFELVFISFGKIDGQARINSVQSVSYPEQTPDLAERCEWKFLDETELNVELRNARNMQRGISNRAVKLYPVGQKGMRGASVIQIQAGEYRSFITALDAKQLVRIYEELDRDALFSLNIRNFIGNTVTNKEILKTAEHHAENFFLYNNGISCLAANVQTATEHLEVVGLQVINGAQTVKALVNLARSRAKTSNHLWTNAVPYILVRITEVPENYGPSAKIREKVTQYNNTQNTIKISDFRSNDDVQKNLQDQFSEITRYGKKVLYLPKRTDKSVANCETIRIEEFAKSIYAFLYDPTAFSGSTSFLFSMDASGGYTRVFGTGEKLWEKMPDEEFRLRSGIYWIAQEITSHIRNIRDSETDPDARAALERKWILLFAVSSVFKSHYKGEKWKHEVRKLYKGDWRITDEGKGAVLSRIFDLAKSAVVLSYKNGKKNNSSFVHRNWMRSKQTPLDISESIELLLPLTSGIHDMPQ